MNRYITILEFMITDLHLKGNELTLYALVYGFSQGAGGEYYGSMEDMCYWTQSTRRGVQKSIEKLVEKNLICKTVKQEGRVRRSIYQAVDGANLVRPENGDGANLVPLRSELSSVTERTEFAPYIVDNNIDNKNDIDICSPPVNMSIEDEFEVVWGSYPRKEGRKESGAAYTRSRKHGASFEKVLNGVKAYAAECRAEKREKRFIKQGSTFFRGENWNDEYTSVAVAEKRYGETGAADW